MGKKFSRTFPVKTWKKFELDIAAFFGGERVPLSGSNSHHDTTSDVLWKGADSPKDWLYIEIKRTRSFLASFAGRYEELRGGQIGIEAPDGFVDENGVQRVLLWLELKRYVAMKEFQKSPFQLVNEKGFIMKLVRGRWQTDLSAAGTLLLECQKKAKKEGKDVTICCFRYHGRHGYVALIEYTDLIRFNAWLATKCVAPRKSRHLKYVSNIYGKADSLLEEKIDANVLRRARLDSTT